MLFYSFSVLFILFFFSFWILFYFQFKEFKIVVLAPLTTNNHQIIYLILLENCFAFPFNNCDNIFIRKQCTAPNKLVCLLKTVNEFRFEADAQKPFSQFTVFVRLSMTWTRWKMSLFCHSVCMQNGIEASSWKKWRKCENRRRSLHYIDTVNECACSQINFKSNESKGKKRKKKPFTKIKHASALLFFSFINR